MHEASAPTFQRRLAAEDVSFKSLLDDARRDTVKTVLTIIAKDEETNEQKGWTGSAH